MNFIERFKPETKVQVINTKIPRIGISSSALVKMFIYVNECSDEVGWLGTVEKLNNQHYVITDVYLFEQDVHATTTEITPEGLSEFAEELLQQPNGMEVWNNIKMWGHSHVNMGVTPSGQDDKQMKEFADVGHEWFIRLIANKKGDMKLDFFHYQMGITFIDVPWEELASDEENNIQEEIYRLQEALELAKENRVQLLSEPIKEEMKAKVRKMRTSYIGVGANYGLNNSNYYHNQFGRYVNGVWRRWEEHPPTEEEKKTMGSVIPKHLMERTVTHIGNGDKKKDTETSTTRTTERTGAKIGRFTEEDMLETDDEVVSMFTTLELYDIATCKSLQDVQEEVEILGYYNYFTENDLERILRVALKYVSRF